jgi:hypothetical protein
VTVHDVEHAANTEAVSMVDSQLTAYPNETSLQTSWTTTRLWIDDSDGAFISAGFTEASNTTATTTGFVMFGTTLMWEGDSGIESKWFGAPTGQEGLWFLKWNVENAIETNVVPIVLKDRASDLK